MNRSRFAVAHLAVTIRLCSPSMFNARRDEVEQRNLPSLSIVRDYIYLFQRSEGPVPANRQWDAIYESPVTLRNQDICKRLPTFLHFPRPEITYVSLSEG